MIYKKIKNRKNTFSLIGLILSILFIYPVSAKELLPLNIALNLLITRLLPTLQDKRAGLKKRG